MKTKLNDNEVSEIAEMQKKIDSYEGFILAIFRMMKSILYGKPQQVCVMNKEKP